MHRWLEPATGLLQPAAFAISEVQPDQALLTNGAGNFRADFADGSLRRVPLELPTGPRSTPRPPVTVLDDDEAALVTAWLP